MSSVISLRLSPWRPVLARVAIAFLVPWGLGKAAEDKAEKPSAPDHAILCSYNLKNWLRMDRRLGSVGGAETPKPEKEKNAVVQTLVAIDADVLGVCEIGSEADLKDLQTRLAAEGLVYPHSEHTHGGDPHRMLALLSRYPITERHSQTALTYLIGEQRFPVNRGFLDVTIQVAPALALRCVGVHLKSKREVTEADQALMRRNEAHLLRLHIEGILQADPTTKVLLYGDFNENRQEPPIAEILGTAADPPKHLTDVFLRDANGEVWTHFWDYQDVYSRFDYFFVSPALRPHVNTRESMIYTSRDFAEASDHRPIVLRVDFAAKKKR